MIECKPTTAALLQRSPATKCRIEWAITGYGTGNGDWHPIEQRPYLQGIADSNCREYGAGTHWIMDN